MSKGTRYKIHAQLKNTFDLLHYKFNKAKQD